MYADDHQLYKINENVSTVNHNLNSNATKASVWYKSNLLKGNLSKYHTMLITNTQWIWIGVRVQGTDVECLNSFKLLGVIINNKLDFSEHVNITCKKASQRIRVLMRLRNIVPTAAFQGCNISLPYLLPSYLVFLPSEWWEKNSNVFTRGVCAQSLGIVNPHMRSCWARLN